jgi:hypothetical protein
MPFHLIRSTEWSPRRRGLANVNRGNARFTIARCASARCGGAQPNVLPGKSVAFPVAFSIAERQVGRRPVNVTEFERPAVLLEHAAPGSSCQGCRDLFKGSSGEITMRKIMPNRRITRVLAMTAGPLAAGAV